MPRRLSLALLALTLALPLALPLHAQRTDTALSELAARLKASPRSTRISTRTAAAFRATVSSAQAAVQKARASLDAGDYQVVTTSLDRVLESIRKALSELGGISTQSSKRTR